MKAVSFCSLVGRNKKWGKNMRMSNLTTKKSGWCHNHPTSCLQTSLSVLHSEGGMCT